MSRLLVFNFKDFPPKKRLKSKREEGNTDSSLNVSARSHAPSSLFSALRSCGTLKPARLTFREVRQLFTR